MCLCDHCEAEPTSVTPRRHRGECVSSERQGRANELRSSCQPFSPRIYLLPRLPSSSTSNLHPPTDPSDQGPALAPLHPNAKQPSVCKRRGVRGVRSYMSKDESFVNSTMINKGLMWTMNHFRGPLPKPRIDLPVMRTRMPAGDGSRNASSSSHRWHISERSSCRPQPGGPTSTE